VKKWAIFSVALGHLVDICTTALPGGLEENPFARTASYHPLICRLVLIKIIFAVPWASVALIAYLQLKKWSQLAADCAVVGFCLYLAAHTIPIFIDNFVNYLGWYQG